VTQARAVLVLGGTSGIGRSTAAAFARRGYEVVVTGREASEATRAAQDLAIRFGVLAHGKAFDATGPDGHPAFFAEVVDATGGRLQGVVAAFGLLGDQVAARENPSAAARIIATNYTGVVSILSIAASWFEERRHGFIVGIGSVAGDRGRQSNYLYGSAKAGAAVFLAGLRNRLHRAGVNVVTVKPGFVDTEMTFGLPGLFLVADPEMVGERIARAVERRLHVVYVPWFWRWIMLIIRLIPERLFKRLSL
jgi:short-subunit dehydrogenase